MGCTLFQLDADIIDLLIGIPVCIIFLLFFYKMLVRIGIKRKYPQIFAQFIDGFRLKVPPARVILIAVILAALLSFIWLFAWHAPQAPKMEIISNVLFHPFAEEFIYRAFILGAMLLAANIFVTEWQPGRTAKFTLFFFAVFIQAAIFGYQHGAFFQLLQGMLLGWLFIGYKLGYRNNLLPPIVAHITHNCIIVWLCCTAGASCVG